MKFPELGETSFVQGDMLVSARGLIAPQKSQGENVSKYSPLCSSICNTLQRTNISPKNGILKMIFLFPRWDMLIPWRVGAMLEQSYGATSQVPKVSPDTL